MEQNFKSLLYSGVAAWGVKEAKEGGLFQMAVSVNPNIIGGKINGSVSMSTLEATLSTTVRKEMRTLQDAQDEYVLIRNSCILNEQEHSYTSQASRGRE